MANWYVWSGAGGTGTGASWANAYVRLRLAMAAKAAGDTFFVAHDHAETEAAAMAIVSPGTNALPCRVYCVNRAGSVPPVSADLRTTATISTTGAFAITITGTIAECYGIIFSSGSAASAGSLFVNNTAGRNCKYVNCALRLGNTSSSSHIELAASGANETHLENTTVQFGAVAQTLRTNSRVFWRNTPSAFTGATFPTTVFAFLSGGSEVYLEGVDLSALGSGKSLFNNGSNVPGVGVLKDCKLGASVAVIPSAYTTGWGQSVFQIIRCDSGDSNYRTEKYSFAGTLTTETTIVRTGGASDGTTPISWKIVTMATNNWEHPFESLPISIWNDTTGSAITVTIEGIWGGGAVPLNDEIWIDVEYLGTSGFPLASKATSTKADGLATGANIPAGSGTWGGSTTKFAMSATFTPQEKGPITIYVRAAKVSSTFYIDPKPVIT